MVATKSTMLTLGTQCPDFELPDGGGAVTRSTDLLGKPLVVAFISNHCPFVVHLNEALAEFGRYATSSGATMVAISSNNVAKYPQDGPELMVEESRKHGYTFPYLYDATQDVAKSFRAACTPDFYIFGADGKLTYRGQFDSSRPSSGLAVTGSDLRAALDATVANDAVPALQVASMGCNIKWIPGQEPDYFG